MTEDRNSSRIIQKRNKAKRGKTVRVANIAARNNQFVPMVDYEKAKQLATEGKIDQILEIIKSLQLQLNQQKDLLNKIASLIIKLYNDNEINKDTFNKLDEFLKPYYDHLYEDG